MGIDRESFEAELESERRFEIDQRFRPEILRATERMRADIERLRDLAEAASDENARLREAVESIQLAMSASSRDVAPGFRWTALVVIVLLGIIAFK